MSRKKRPSNAERAEAVPSWRSLLAHGYYCASWPYRWWWGRRAGDARRAPAIVLFYHRIADDGANGWTVSHRAFERQLDWLAARCDLVSLADLQDRLRHGNSRPCVSITFDDGYADNCRRAIPLLVSAGIPCTYFVSLENVVHGVPFPHDRQQGREFRPNTIEELRAMASAGIDIGAHTNRHLDLGQVTDPEELRQEIAAPRQALEALVGVRVRYFAFPFGQRANLSLPAFAVARQSGYEAACSAYGGYNFPGDDPFHLQRIAADESMIRLKNWVTIDPRKLRTPRYAVPGPC